jgi:hypothetical protein
MKIRDFDLKISRVIVICVIVSLLTGVIVHAVSPTQPFTINRGIYPSGPSYTIWEEDGNYFAKNTYGVIAYSGTDAAVVIQAALDNGGQIYLSGGNYILEDTIWLTDNCKITGEGIESTVLVQNADLGGLVRGGSAYLSIDGVENVSLSDFSIYGYQGGSDTNNGIAFEESTNIKICNVDVCHVQSNAFRFSDSTNVYLSNLRAENVELYQGYSFDGIFDSVLTNLVAVNCGGYALDLSYARNVAVNNCVFNGEATSIKVDLGAATEYSSGVTLNNIIVRNTGTVYNGLIIQDTYNSTFSNLYFENGFRAIRCERVGLSTFTNIVISNMTGNAVYLAQNIDRLVFSNIVSEATISTAFSIGTTTKVTVMGSTFKDGLIVDAGTDTHIHATYNSSVWIGTYP